MTKPTTRRGFLRLAGQGIVLAPVVAPLASMEAGAVPLTGSAPGVPPRPAVRLTVTSFGAVGDSRTMNTAAIQQAIDRASVLGGGEVVIPRGRFLCGAIRLRARTTLVLEAGAVLLGSPDMADYPVTQVRWEGKWTGGHTALIYAIDETDVGIRGPGEIRGSEKLGGRPTKTNPLRHPALIETIGCKRVLLEGFSAYYHLMWCIHPTYTDQLAIRKLTIRSTGGNGDGIDVDSCRHVVIEDCDIATGDDCIAIKSGRGMEGYLIGRPTEDVRITGCRFQDAIFACIGIGSETSGGIRDVHISHCTFTRARTFAIYIKSHVGRGAFIEHITAEDLDVSGMQGGFLRLNLLTSGIRDPDPVPGNTGIPELRDLRFSRIRVTDVPVLVEATAIHPAKPLEGFSLSSVTGSCREGVFLAHIKNAVLKDLRLSGYSGPLVHATAVSGRGLDGAVPVAELPTPPPVVEEPATPYRLH